MPFANQGSTDPAATTEHPDHTLTSRLDSPPAGHFRWTICALLFFATTVNYADRQILGILAPMLQKEIGWSEAQYGIIVTAFQTAYAAGLIGVGRFIDRAGTRLGYALALAWWSFAAMAHGLVTSVFGFGFARFLLGLGEAGNFPAAVKAVSDWFPKRERALATGWFNSGSNVGAILAPLTVPWLALHFGWRWAFVAVGGAGFLWIAAWLRVYRDPAHHPRLSRSELDYIQSDPPEPNHPVSWRVLICARPVWGLLLARFLTDPVWWFYLFWAPKFLNSRFGLKLDQIGVPVATMYLVSNAGGILGGWLSSFLIRRQWSTNTARKAAMLACTGLVMPIVFAPRVATAAPAVALMCLAMAGHQGWSANVYTMVSDMFPRRVVSSVVGICGFGGAVGGMLAASAVGLVLQATGSYVSIFALAGSGYLIGLSMIHLMTPRKGVVDLEAARW
jgi:ACS family hexuronate transporter-like MFS transporter